MIDKYLQEQKTISRILKNAVTNNKISHAYLFEINGYKNYNEYILSFVKMLLCPKKYSNNENCQNCVQCQNIEKGNFPELKIIRPDGLWIKKEQLDELQKDFSTKSVQSNRRVYIIEQADRLNTQSANSILKFLEEPEENITAILLTDNIYKMLNTIVSRCQIITFARTNKYDQNNMIDKIKNNMIIEIDDETLKKRLEDAINYVNYFEKNGIDTLLKNQKLWHNNFKEKIDVVLGFNIIILFYKEIINYKVKEEIEIFEQYSDIIKQISEKNTLEKINNKINIILKNKQKIDHNVNSNLLMDKLIIELERCDKND